MIQIFWSSLLFIVYTYLMYPLVIVLWSKIFPKPIRMSSETFDWPSVTLVVIAYNEEMHILRKIETCRELDYPKELFEICIVSDGSTDQTNDILCEQNDIRVIIDPENHGKPHQINRAVNETESDIIVFADARQTFKNNAIKMLVRNFSDPEIGAVSGELELVSNKDQTEQNIGLYWKYEKILRKAESIVDSTIGVTGAIYAMRRNLFVRIPDNIILDDIEIPLHAFRKGYRIVFEQEAKAYDSAESKVSHEFKRKVRTLSGNFQLFVMNPWLFNPAENRIFIQTLSHKMFRLIIPHALILLLVSSALIDETFYKFSLLTQTICYLIGTLGILFHPFKRNRIINLMSVFITLNAAAYFSLFLALLRRFDSRWRK